MSKAPERRTVRLVHTRVLLGPVATTFATVNTGSWRTERPHVDCSRCTRCGVCAQHCPPGAIEIHKEKEEECVFFDWCTCKGCGICANVCPKECIAMTQEPKQDGH